VKNETVSTKVLILPNKIRNCLLSNLPVIFDPIIAAWLDPNPGRKEQIGETSNVVINGLIVSLNEKTRLFVVCMGIFVAVLIEYNMVDVPNNPVSSGKSGSFVLVPSVEIPRNPARAKIRILPARFLLSVTKNIEIQIRIQAIIRSIY